MQRRLRMICVNSASGSARIFSPVADAVWRGGAAAGWEGDRCVAAFPRASSVFREIRVPLRQIEYKGMTLKAAAFEVVGLGGFVPSLSIERAGVRADGRSGRACLFDPPCPNGFFETDEEALDETLAYGMAIIDGEIRGLTVDDL